MALKDKSGLMKQVAFVSVRDFSIVGIGDSSEEAYRNYRGELAKNRDASAPGPKETIESASGKVSRVSVYSVKGDTDVLFILNGKKFSVSAFYTPDAALLRDGDVVTIKYSREDFDKGFYRVSWFEATGMNNSLTTAK